MVKVWIASAGFRHYDALALGRTSDEALAAMIAEIRHQYKNDYTDEEIAENTYLRCASIPFAELS